MLTQLKRLSVEAEGRYASPQELKFADEYFQSLPVRLSAYQKLRECADEIISLTEKEIRAKDAKILTAGIGDATPLCLKDIRRLLVHTGAALLFNDRDRLNESLLIWYSTVVKSFKLNRTTKMVFQVMPDIAKNFFTPEEFALLAPLLSLNGVVLG